MNTGNRSYLLVAALITAIITMTACEVDVTINGQSEAEPTPDAALDELTPTPTPEREPEPTLEAEPTATPDAAPDPIATSHADEPATEQAALYPIRNGDRWGYIDRDGTVAIEPQWDRAHEFSEGRAIVRQGGQFGAIDEFGTVVVDIEYDGMAPFSDGVAPIGVGGEPGHHGTLVDADWGYVDLDGNVVIEPQFELAGSFSEGLAPVGIDGLVGFIDREGNVVIDAEYDWADPFSEGISRAVADNQYDVYLDRQGEIVREWGDQRVSGFHEGYASIMVAEGFGFINREFEIVVAPRFISVRNFSEGLAAVSPEEGVWGFVNENDELVIEPQFDAAEPFSEGLAAVRIGDDMGFVDRDGYWQIPPEFDRVFPFRDGLAIGAFGENIRYAAGGFDPLEAYDGWGYIDRSGGFVWGPID